MARFFYKKLIGSKNLIWTHLLKNYDSHIEMMMFHSRRGINCGKWGSDVYHEFIVKTSVIQIMADGSNEHGQTLKMITYFQSCTFFHLGTPNVSYRNTQV